jgi:hypothetical protein
LILYLLTLTDTELSYGNHSEDFDIGLFATEQQAEDIARNYLQNVQGFCEFPCTYRIKQKAVLGSEDDKTPVFVWMVQGWNTNEAFDEIDVIESDCFSTEAQAKNELAYLKHQYEREEWTITRWKIDERCWQEGFIRMDGQFPR